MQRMCGVSQVDKFTETSANVKDDIGNMRVNCSNVFQTGQELFNCDMFLKDEGQTEVSITNGNSLNIQIRLT